MRKRKQIRIGKLGRRVFPRGTYLYTGSAMNGLGARLSRHLKIGPKKSHWHIDYLLKAPEARIRKILVATVAECKLNQCISALSGARVVVKGFGASDCTSGCPSHLIYFAPGSLAKNLPIHKKKGSTFSYFWKSFRSQLHVLATDSSSRASLSPPRWSPRPSSRGFLRRRVNYEAKEKPLAPKLLHS